MWARPREGQPRGENKPPSTPSRPHQHQQPQHQHQLTPAIRTLENHPCNPSAAPPRGKRHRNAATAQAGTRFSPSRGVGDGAGISTKPPRRDTAPKRRRSCGHRQPRVPPNSKHHTTIHPLKEPPRTRPQCSWDRGELQHRPEKRTRRQKQAGLQPGAAAPCGRTIGGQEHHHDAPDHGPPSCQGPPPQQVVAPPGRPRRHGSRHQRGGPPPPRAREPWPAPSTAQKSPAASSAPAQGGWRQRRGRPAATALERSTGRGRP